ncbi:MAG: hypothetical protein ACREBR_02695 [bacterium]
MMAADFPSFVGLGYGSVLSENGSTTQQDQRPVAQQQTQSHPEALWQQLCYYQQHISQADAFPPAFPSSVPSYPPPASFMPPSSQPLTFQQQQQQLLPVGGEMVGLGRQAPGYPHNYQQQQQQQQHAATTQPSPQTITTTKTSSSMLDSTMSAIPESTLSLIGISDASKARAKCRSMEAKKLHCAYIRNLQYLAQCDEEQIQQQLEHVQRGKEQSMAFQRKMERDYEKKKKKQQQQQALLMSKAGIGTSDRKAAIQSINRSIPNVNNNNSKNNGNSSAIYVSGLKNVTQETEQMLRSLFGSSSIIFGGRVQRVTLYRNKTNGEYKGDALIVFNEKDQVDLCNVCTQVS